MPYGGSVMTHLTLKSILSIKNNLSEIWKKEFQPKKHLCIECQKVRTFNITLVL
jgi:hypothetical protein